MCELVLLFVIYFIDSYGKIVVGQLQIYHGATTWFLCIIHGHLNRVEPLTVL